MNIERYIYGLVQSALVLCTWVLVSLEDCRSDCLLPALPPDSLQPWVTSPTSQRWPASTRASWRRQRRRRRTPCLQKKVSVCVCVLRHYIICTFNSFNAAGVLYIVISYLSSALFSFQPLNRRRQRRRREAPPSRHALYTPLLPHCLVFSHFF